jgi:hypothetical protein
MRTDWAIPGVATGVVMLAMALLSAGCRGDSVGCETSRDCFADEICVAGACQPSATGAGDAGQVDTSHEPDEDVATPPVDSGGNVGEPDSFLDAGGQPEEDVGPDHDAGEHQPLTGFVAISAAGFHSCALTHDGQVYCWGGQDETYASNGVEGAPTEGTYLSVHTGWQYSCARRHDRTVLCWGRTTNYNQVPPNHEQFESFSTGSWHTCGLRDDGTAGCWGRNDKGATDLPGDLAFLDIVAGEQYSCGLTQDDSIVCWGDPDLDELPRQTTDENFLEVYAGELLACGLNRERELECWGRTETEVGKTPPRGPYLTAALGRLHGCAIRLDKTMSCWGSDWAGQARTPSGTFRAVAAGERHSCAIRTNGTIHCWGDNDKGQLDAPTLEE